jgi:translation elongation factor EF-1beta
MVGLKHWTHLNSLLYLRWDDTIDIKEIEKHVRAIETDGLVWGTSKVLPVAFGINKLQVLFLTLRKKCMCILFIL